MSQVTRDPVVRLSAEGPHRERALSFGRIRRDLFESIRGFCSREGIDPDHALPITGLLESRATRLAIAMVTDYLNSLLGEPLPEESVAGYEPQVARQCRRLFKCLSEVRDTELELPALSTRQDAGIEHVCQRYGCLLARAYLEELCPYSLSRAEIRNLLSPRPGSRCPAWGPATPRLLPSPVMGVGSCSNTETL